MNKWKFVSFVTVAVLVADQVTKLGVWRFLQPSKAVAVIPGFFNLVLSLNPGIAFGMMAGGQGGWRTLILIAGHFLALGLLLAFTISAKPRERLFLWGLALVAGGDLGNLIDRWRLGAVIDFLDFYIGRYHWHTFNIADAGITIGAVLIALHLWRSR